MWKTKSKISGMTGQTGGTPKTPEDRKAAALVQKMLDKVGLWRGNRWEYFMSHQGGLVPSTTIGYSTYDLEKSYPSSWYFSVGIQTFGSGVGDVTITHSDGEYDYFPNLNAAQRWLQQNFGRKVLAFGIDPAYGSNPFEEKRLKKMVDMAKRKGMTKEEVLALVKRRPAVYTELAIALGYLKKSSLIPGGNADGMHPSDFDPLQLAKGIKVEMEHTDDVDLAQEIAMDHLMEFDDYYDRLEVMEDEAVESIRDRDSGNFEQEIIHLGSTNPELRPHLRPILASLKSASPTVAKTLLSLRAGDAVEVVTRKYKTRILRVESNPEKQSYTSDAGVKVTTWYVGVESGTTRSSRRQGGLLSAQERKGAWETLYQPTLLQEVDTILSLKKVARPLVLSTDAKDGKP